MKTAIRSVLTVCGLLGAAGAVALDTTDPFLCAVSQVNECLDGFGCEAVLPESVNAPTFIWVDMSKKQIRTNHEASGSRISTINELDGRHVLQGASAGTGQSVDGAGWTLSIENETGRFVGAVAVQQASITLFGACTELELE